MKFLQAILLLFYSLSLATAAPTAPPPNVTNITTTTDILNVTTYLTTTEQSTTTVSTPTSKSPSNEGDGNAGPTAEATRGGDLHVVDPTTKGIPSDGVGNVDHAKQPDKNTERKTPGMMLYEIERDILNLSLEDIDFILGMETDNAVVSYAIADKLGYLKSGDDSDPHLKVIEDNQKRLVSKLKTKKDHILKSMKEATQAPTTPPPPTTTSEDKISYFEYDIMKKIACLSDKQISGLLNNYGLESFIYALDAELGFDTDSEYALYLQEQDAEKWREIVFNQKEKRIKCDEEPPSTKTESDLDNKEPPLTEKEYGNYEQSPGDYDDNNPGEISLGAGGDEEQYELSREGVKSKDEGGKDPQVKVTPTVVSVPPRGNGDSGDQQTQGGGKRKGGDGGSENQGGNVSEVGNGAGGSSRNDKVNKEDTGKSTVACTLYMQCSPHPYM